MNNFKAPLNKLGVSRRSFIFSTGGGLMATLLLPHQMANALGNNVAIPSSSITGAVNDAIAYFEARANVSAAGSSNNYSKFILPDSKSMINFEQERFATLSQLGSATRWNGIMDNISSTPQIVSAIQIDSRVRVLVNDWTSINWRPAPPLIPIVRTPAELAFVQKDPVRYGLNVLPWTPTDSGFGTTHLLTLENVSGNWFVVQDGYDERILIGQSTDYSATTESQAIQQAYQALDSASLKAEISPTIQSEPNAANLTPYIFDYQAAVTYALYWATRYNSAYPIFGSVHEDCANFVSQALAAGGHQLKTLWNYNTPANSATADWDNNESLRSWLITTTQRGYDETSGMLGLADCVNYDWTNNGSFDHIAIVTSFGSVPMVSCHSDAVQSAPYNAIWGTGYMTSQVREYTGTRVYYSE